MIIYKISNIIRESFNRTKSQALTTSLSRQIFNIVRDNLGKNIVGESLKVDDQCNLILNVNYVGNKNLFNKNFFINAFTSKVYKEDDNQLYVITVTISFNSLFSTTDFDRFYYNLYHAIRHELRHYWQYLDPNYIIKENDLTYEENLLANCKKLKDYILSDQELVAEISGLVFSSQKQRKQFGLVVDERLMELFFLNSNTEKNNILSSSIGKEVKEIIDEVKRNIMSRAEQIYPNTRLI